MTHRPREQRIEHLVEGTPEVPIGAPRSSHACRVRALWNESPRYTGIRIEVDDELRTSYSRPGQYVTLAPPETEPRFVVIASGPGAHSEGGWEFLIDEETGLGEALESIDEGSTLQVTPAEGPGYPVDEVGDRHVLCFTTGSGIASIRPAVQYWSEHPDVSPTRVTIYYGESRPGDFAYRDEVHEWGGDETRLYQCCESRPEDADEPHFTYVQHAFEHDAPPLEEAIAFLSGAPVMKRVVVERLSNRGLDLDDIVTNV